MPSNFGYLPVCRYGKNLLTVWASRSLISFAWRFVYLFVFSEATAVGTEQKQLILGQFVGLFGLFLIYVALEAVLVRSYLMLTAISCQPSNGCTRLQ